jgi:small subunit ribosomal protein S7
MGRRHAAEKRTILPDSRYNDLVVAKFINSLLSGGKKSLAEGILYGTFDRIGEKVKEEPLRVFRKAVDNASPLLEVRSRRVGGATYQVPVEVKTDRRLALGIRWIIEQARGRSGNSMVDKLTAEVLDAFNNTGGAIKKKEEVHRMAEANKAFAHYRW